MWALSPLSSSSPGLKGGSPQALPSDMWPGCLPDGYSNSVLGHVLSVVPGPDQRCSLVPVPSTTIVPRSGDHAPDLQLLPAEEESGYMNASEL